MNLEIIHQKLNKHLAQINEWFPTMGEFYILEAMAGIEFDLFEQHGFDLKDTIYYSQLENSRIVKEALEQYKKAIFFTSPVLDGKGRIKVSRQQQVADVSAHCQLAQTHLDQIVKPDELSQALQSALHNLAKHPLQHRSKVTYFQQWLSTGQKPDQISQNHDPDQILIIPDTVTFYPALAQQVLQSKIKDVDRAYPVWLLLLEHSQYCNGHNWYDYGSLVDFLAEYADVSPRTAKRWLRAGKDIFWSIDWKHGRKRVSFFGKDSVHNLFQIVKPGQVSYPAIVDLLTEDIGYLRAYMAMADRTKVQWISREKRAELTGIKGRTQYNYEKTLEIKVQPVFANDRQFLAENGYIRQLPNLYSTPDINLREQENHGYEFNVRSELDTAVNFSVQDGRPTSNIAVKVVSDQVESEPQKLFFEYIQGAKVGNHAKAIKASEKQQCETFAQMRLLKKGLIAKAVSKKGGVLVKVYGEPGTS